MHSWHFSHGIYARLRELEIMQGNVKQIIGFVNSFHPTLKFTWDISETAVTFLDINISVQDNNLATRSDLSKPVVRHFNLPGHSHELMEICGIYLHFGNNETRKRKEQRLIFKLGTLAPNGINERFSFA